MKIKLLPLDKTDVEANFTHLAKYDFEGITYDGHYFYGRTKSGFWDANIPQGKTYVLIIEESKDELARTDRSSEE